MSERLYIQNDPYATYEIKVDPEWGEAIYCRMCFRTSYHPEDLKNRYCANCKQFHLSSRQRHGMHIVESKGVPNNVSYFTFKRHENVAWVFYNGKPLDPRFDLNRHSPDGFNWGYLGSGPAQLALAMLARVFNEHTALYHYQNFKVDVIGPMKSDFMTITFLDIADWAMTNRVSMLLTEKDIGRKVVYIPHHCKMVTDKDVELGVVAGFNHGESVYPETAFIRYENEVNSKSTKVTDIILLPEEGQDERSFGIIKEAY